MRSEHGLAIRPAKWLGLFIGMLAIVIFFSLGLSAHAKNGAQQISGYGEFATDCDAPDGLTPDFVQRLHGDLEGCLFVFVIDATCTPSGVYNEIGTELFVANGNSGADTFETDYRFTARFDDCTDFLANATQQFWGRCQHPIAAGSGTGIFEGVTGRLDFKDDVDAGKAYYRGHLKWSS